MPQPAGARAVLFPMRRAWLITGALLASSGVSARAQPGDWTVQRDPFDRTVIARYKAILSRTPHDRMALSALVSLYKRHRSVDLLVREYETAADSGDATDLVVLARLVRSRGDNPRAREILKRAVVLRPDDAWAWQALGELANAASDHGAARTAFTEAAARTTNPATKQAALRALVPLLTSAKNVAAVEHVFDDLATLRPRDGLLWTERGDALLEMAQWDGALAAYSKAEALLAHDPERKLLAISARGRTLDRAGKPTEAIAEYDRAIAASPRGYYLRRELTLRIVELVRKDGSARAVAELERRWPEAQRDAFEWSTLADYYDKNGDGAKQIAALATAAKQAPRDVAIQWKVIRLLDRLQRPGNALAALETAVRASPKDLALVLELAQRIVMPRYSEDDEAYEGPDSPTAARASRLLADLSRAHPRDADAHAAIGEVYARWKDTPAALREFKLAAMLEPDDDRLVVLGDAYAEDGQIDNALLTWRRLGANGNAKGLARLATVLADHRLWDDAISAYSAAMMKDPKNFALWRGRALALAETDAWYSAITDAEYAITLMGAASMAQGYETRIALVDILDRRVRADAEDIFGENQESFDELRDHLVAWGKAFRQAKPDIGAGYMLAAYFARHRSSSLVPILIKLQTLAPADEAVVLELVRAYRIERRFDEALATARALSAKNPARMAEVDTLAASIEIDRKHHIEQERAAAEDAADSERVLEMPSSSDAWSRRGGAGRVPLVAGARIGLGLGLGGETEQTLTIGSWDAVPLTKRFDLIVRADWTQHVGHMRSTNAIAGGLGIARHMMATTNNAVMVAAGLRAERRLGDIPSDAPWERWGFAADVGLDLPSRHLPATPGVPWEQSRANPARGPTGPFRSPLGLRCLDLRANGGSGACR